MNYPINIESWKMHVQQNAHPLKDIHDFPSTDGICLVLNLDEAHNSRLGYGPACMAFAKYNYETEKFMSILYPEDEISYQDFKDVCNHNVGGHSGKITHWLSDYDLTCLITDLLFEIKL